MTPEQLNRLAKGKNCPACGDLDKTVGSLICSQCRHKLPSNMRAGLDSNEAPRKDYHFLLRAVRGAANYFNQHFQSVRNFGGGRKR